MVVAVEAYNYELQFALIAQNRGISLVPKRLLRRSWQRSHLRAMHVAGLEFPLVVWVVYRESSVGLDCVITSQASDIDDGSSVRCG